MNQIRPQKGKQEQFLSTSADVAIYGGAAGGGKSYALLLEPLRHVLNNKLFSAVFFRRNTTQIRNPGGLWDEAMKIYPLVKGVPLQQPLEWKFPNGGKLKFAHLENESTVHDWQGSQIPLIIFDELCHFTRNQFFYMLSRNRSVCGVKPYVRASCNPDADSWVAEFISWYIDQDTGLAIQERSGVVRWFIVLSDNVIWADTKEELIESYGDDVYPKSFTFVSASIHDNKILMENDPGYIANLNALSVVEKARLLGGNWKIRPAAGLLFRREWCEVVDALPADIRIVRYWDLAATEKTQTNDPDWTVGNKLGHSKTTGYFYMINAIRMQASPGRVKESILNTASADGKSVKIGIPQDPAQAGKSQVLDFANLLKGYNFSSRIESGDKVTRFSPFSAQCEAGNVKVLRGSWNERTFDELEGFPDGAHKDDADAWSGAFAMINDKVEPRPPQSFNRSFIGR